jgi:hypothetical protein
MKLASLFVLAAAVAAHAADLKPETAAAFDRYAAATEERIRAQQSRAETFLDLGLAGSPQRRQAEARLRRGEALIHRPEKADSPRPGTSLPGALLHHWIGTIFIPGASMAETLALVQDYDHLAPDYAPEMVRSRLLSRRGDDFRVAMRLRKHKVVTVVLDTEYSVHYGRLDAAHQYSTSRSTEVREIVNADEPGEHAHPPGHDSGFLWRLNSYWRFVEAGDGVFVECEAVSLTRDIPAGLGWLIGPFIESIPRESLEFTLQATRRAVISRKSSQQSAVSSQQAAVSKRQSASSSQQSAASIQRSAFSSQQSAFGKCSDAAG